MEKQETEMLQKPDDVIEMEKILAPLQTYIALVNKGTFPGNACRDTAALIDYLKAEYEKVFSIYKEHPFVKPFFETARK